MHNRNPFYEAMRLPIQCSLATYQAQMNLALALLEFGKAWRVRHFETMAAMRTGSASLAGNTAGKKNAQAGADGGTLPDDAREPVARGTLAHKGATDPAPKAPSAAARKAAAKAIEKDDPAASGAMKTLDERRHATSGGTGRKTRKPVTKPSGKHTSSGKTQQ